MVTKLESEDLEVQVDALQSLRFLCHKHENRVRLRAVNLPAELVSVMSRVLEFLTAEEQLGRVILRDGLSIAQSLTGRPEYLPVLIDVYKLPKKCLKSGTG